MNETGSVVDANEAATDLWGYSRSELCSMDVGEFSATAPGFSQEQAAAEMREAVETGHNRFEWQIDPKDGDETWVEVTLRPVTLDDTERLLAIVRDVSDRKRHERRLAGLRSATRELTGASTREAVAEIASRTGRRLLDRTSTALWEAYETGTTRVAEAVDGVAALVVPLRVHGVIVFGASTSDRFDDASVELAEILDFAVDGAQRMTAMIDGLLRYSRVHTHGGEFAPTDLNAVVESVRQDLELRIAETDATLTVEDLPTVVGDEGQLRQLLQNLVENAVRYAGDDPPSIRIDATETDDAYRITVADDGVGIPERDQDRIFEIFSQGGRIGPHEDGNGIGLAVCQRVAHRHGGDIAVESTPGEGATFTITLPKEGER